jgi:uncharacterized repeat protein (TIGR01451 family)
MAKAATNISFRSMFLSLKPAILISKNGFMRPLLLVIFGLLFTSFAFSQTVQIKKLYLSDPSQALDRIDPVTTSDATTAQTATFGPTTVSLTSSGDTYLTKASASSNYGTCTTFDVAGGSTGALVHGLLMFDLSSIPTGSTITSATLTLTNSAGSTTATNVSIHQITTSWTEGPGGCAGAASTAASWNNRLAGTSWTTGGGDYNASAAATTSVAGYAAYTWNLQSLVQNWVTTPANNLGALVKLENESIALAKTFNSRENATASSRPTLSITYNAPSIATFTQGTPLCSALTIKSGQTITVTNYVSIVSGTMPSTPSITALLRYGSTNIISLSSPSYSSGASTLTWTGTLGSDVTVPAGQAIVLAVTSTETGATFKIDYDSQTKPSAISLPVTTYINIDSKDVYDAAYSGGSIVTSGLSGSTVYARATVSDPFGFSDITGLDLQITPPTGGPTTVAATSVATSGCTRTYEYAWTNPVNVIGSYSLQYTAKEGTEGTVTSVQTQTFTRNSPSSLTVTKTKTSPATGPFTINNNIVYNIAVANTGTVNITTLPLYDIFSTSCLQFISASPAQTSVSGGTVTWANLGTLAPGATVNVSVTMKVIGNCNPAANTATVSGAIDVNGSTVTSGTFSSTINITIDEPPISLNDEFCVSTTTNLNVLANDSDPDNDLTTVTIVTAPPAGKGTTTVNPDKTIQFIPSGSLVDDELVSFTYRVCDNTSPTVYCDTATVTLYFSNFNDPPALVNDVAATTVNLPTTISVLTNDNDVDGNLNIGTLTITANPSYGAATVNPDGTVYYVPNPGFTGTDQFTYQIFDDGCPSPTKSATATVFVTVVYAEYVCEEGSNTLSVPAVAGATGYTWSGLPTGATVTSGAGTRIITVDWSNVALGTYDVCVEPSNDCGPGTEKCVKVVVSKLTLTATPSNILCSGINTGSINLTVTGGISPNTYSWVRSGGGYSASIEDISGLSPGTYLVTATDMNGCVGTASASITQPATALSASGSVTNENPYGTSNGAISLTPSGGTAGYSYLWSNTAISEDLTGIPGGAYSVTVTDANGCTVVMPFTVNSIGAPLSVASIVATNVLCNGGSTGTINLEIIGGSGTYTYLWSPGGATTQDLSGLAAGTYNVTINDGVNPAITSSATITQPTTALALSATTTNNLCFGETSGAVNLTVSGGTSPYSYAWSTGTITEDLSGLAIGTYVVTVTDANACTSTLSRTITQPALLDVTASLVETNCSPGNNGSIDITPSGGTPGYTYLWSNAATTQDISGLSAGNYSVTITDLNGCQKIATYEIESACIGVAKSLVSTPENNGDGTYSVTYDIRVENNGTVSLSGIQVVENLHTTFSSATSFTLTSLNITAQPASNTWVKNTSYDGDAIVGLPTDVNLLSSTGSLLINEYAIFRLVLTVTPGSSLGVYNNSASASGQSAAGKTTSDTSQNGTAVDPDSDGNPGNNSVPTPITFTETPEIGVAKTIGVSPVNNNNGTYTLSYNLKVQNTGDVKLSSVQVVDNLATAFPGLTISSASVSVVSQPASTTLTPNGSYNGTTTTTLLSGSNSLNLGEFGVLQVTLTVALNGSLGPFNNSASVSALSPSGATTSDVSQNGTNVDPDSDGNPSNNSVPTPVTFTETAEIGLAKYLYGTPVNNGDGTYSLKYRLKVENTGNAPLSNVQVMDNLATTFTSLTLSAVSASVVTQPATTTLTANGSYDGSSNTNLLSGSNSLKAGEYGILEISLTVQLSGSLGPFNNTASASGTGTGGTAATDNSYNGSIVDPDGDGNPTNNASPTPVTFTETPKIGVAKTISSSPTNNNDGTYTLTYSILVENVGNVPLNAIQVTDNLSTTFTGATSFTVTNVTSPDFTVNFPGYNGVGNLNLLTGTNNNFGVGAQGTILVTVTVTPGGKLGTYNNTAIGSGTSLGGATATDNSYDGTIVDPDSDGNPTNNSKPTPVRFTENPMLGLAKRVVGTPTDNLNGTFTVTYEIYVENMGDVPLNDIHIVDDLNETFAGATSFVVNSKSSSTFTINSSYNGTTNLEVTTGVDDLAVGANGTITMVVTVTPGSFNKVFNNGVIGYGLSPALRLSMENSTDGSDPDPDNDGNPTNNSTPTPVSFPSAIIGAGKRVTSTPATQPDGTYIIGYEVRAKNMGYFDLWDLQMFDTLTTEFGTYVAGTPTLAGQYTVSTAPTLDYIDAGSALTVNPGFTGSGANTQLLSLNSGDMLQIGDSVRLSFSLRFFPAVGKYEFSNQMTAVGDKTENGVVDRQTVDPSNDGLAIDGDSDGIPNETLANENDNWEDNTPTIFSLEICNDGNDNDGDGLIDCADILDCFPTVDITETDASCIPNDGIVTTGDSATLTASGGSTYLWSTTETTVAIVVSPVSTTTYTVTATDANGCTATDSYTVEIQTTATGNESYNGCQGDGYAVTVNGNVYNESNASGTETLTTSFGCDSIVTILLVYHPQPNVTTIPATVCSGSSLSLQTLMENAGAVAADTAFFTSLSNALSNINALASPVVTATSNTKYYVRLTGQANPGCFDIDSIEITVTQIQVNIIQACYDNGTPTDQNDDYFTIELTATNASPGVSGQYEVYFGTDLLGTASYGNAINLQWRNAANTLRFLADGVSTYGLTIQDSDINTCETILTTTPEAECSDCPPPTCPPVILTKIPSGSN